MERGVIDRIFNKILPRHNDLNKNFNLKKDIQIDFCHVPDSSTCTIVLFPTNRLSPWNWILKKRYTKKGTSYLSYKISPNILSDDYKTTIKNFNNVQKIVRVKINALHKKYRFTQFNLVGISSSCVSALMIANENTLVKNITSVVPGNCLAESMWKGLRTQYIQKRYKSRRISLYQLKRYWKDLAPENNLDKCKNKKIGVILSRADKTIPYECGKKLVYAMKQRGIKFKLSVNNHLGHYITILKFYLFDKTFSKSWPLQNV